MSDLQLDLISGENPVGRWALLSEDGRYRYALTRTWARELGIVNWIMLNPSTADAREDDPTIRRCVGFARAWGYGGIVVTNLFALRSPAPDVLALDSDPIGPQNDAAVVNFAIPAALHVAAWGAHGGLRGRSRAVLSLLTSSPLRLSLQCLGVTQDGNPRHPLYLPASTPLQRLAA